MNPPKFSISPPHSPDTHSTLSPKPQLYSPSSSDAFIRSATPSPRSSEDHSSASPSTDKDKQRSIIWDKIKLSPYTNQVGGHKAFLRLTENTVCKPLQQTELNFYENLPVDLKPFVPMFLGIIHRSNGVIKYKGVYGGIIEKLVRLDSNVHSFPGRIHNAGGSFGTGKRNLSLTDLVSLLSVSPTSTASPVSDTIKVETRTEKQSEDIFHLDEEHHQHPREESNASTTITEDQSIHLSKNSLLPQAVTTSEPIDIPSKSSTESSSPKDNTPVPYINPWALQQHSSVNLFDEYILLEDLTAYLSHPCILDLKMGTRQHGIYSTAEKRKTQIQKVETSTSSQLGIRLCGMQVYKQSTNRYYFQDKYYGREIKTREELFESFKLFIPKALHPQLPKLIAKIKNLYKVIEKLDGYRFYASSLLLVYDGQVGSGLEITVRMVDFANCVTREEILNYLQTEHGISVFNDSTRKLLLEKEGLNECEMICVTLGDTFEGNDRGYLQGLTTLLEILQDLINSNSNNNNNNNTAADEENDDRFTAEMDASTPIKFARARESFNRSST